MASRKLAEEIFRLINDELKNLPSIANQITCVNELTRMLQGEKGKLVKSRQDPTIKVQEKIDQLQQKLKELREQAK